MRVYLLKDVTTPEPWISGKNKPFFAAGTIVRTIPASNMPKDEDDPILLWVDESAVRDHPYGIGLCRGDFVAVEKELEFNKEMCINSNILSQETIDWLADLPDDGRFICDPVQYGFLVYAAWEDFNNLPDDIPQDLSLMIRLAASSNCKWLRLDCDAPMLTEEDFE